MMGPEDELKKFDSKDSWPMVFQKIRQEASLKHDFSLTDAKKPEFKNRNRYRDVSPYNHSRVQLQRNNIDYINASLVEAPKANRSYILTQGPLEHTCGHFWLLVWEQRSQAILMLNRTMEMGRGPLPDTCGHFWLMAWEQNTRAVLMLNRVIEKGQVKCHQYFPVGNANEGEDDMVFEDVDLQVRFLSEKSRSHYTVRTLELCDLQSGETKQVDQFHYTKWPDFGVPQSPQAFLDFLFEVRRSGALDRNVGPPIIHCSAGIGRSGTFCLVDTCLVLIEDAQSMEHIDVRSILMDMRHYRMGLIQTHDQLRFSYLAIIQGARLVLHGSQAAAASPDSGIDEATSLEHIDRSAQQNGQLPAAMDIDDNDSDEDSLPDTPPPLPPRLGRCIGRPADAIDDEAPSAGTVASSEDEVLVSAGTNSSELDGAAAAAEALRKEGVELRRRKREERIKNTAEQIARMKKKQQESEIWRARKRSARPYLLGISVAFLVGGYLLYRCTLAT